MRGVRRFRSAGAPRALVGPPTYPTTVTTHDLRSGGRVVYHMTGPEGDESHGSWEILEVAPPNRLVFRDAFANADGTPNTDMPINDVRVMITEVGHGQTQMSIESIFPNAAAMEQILAIGMEEGLTESVDLIETRCSPGGHVDDEPMSSPAARSQYNRSRKHPEEGNRVHDDHADDDPHPGRPWRHPDVAFGKRHRHRADLLLRFPDGRASFGTLSQHFSDRTVVTYDPRGPSAASRPIPQPEHGRRARPTICIGSSRRR